MKESEYDGKLVKLKNGKYRKNKPACTTINATPPV
jgi:hypothetical protein